MTYDLILSYFIHNLSRCNVMNYKKSPRERGNLPISIYQQTKYQILILKTTTVQSKFFSIRYFVFSSRFFKRAGLASL